jgi:hypothetical protein
MRVLQADHRLFIYSEVLVSFSREGQSCSILNQSANVLHESACGVREGEKNSRF